jgi:protocatechuate 3,4-dioxygenase beta subunit
MSRPSPKKNRQNPFKFNQTRLSVEALEDRVTPSTVTNTISGFVYYDANNNGLFDPGETPIANNTIQLQNSSGTVIGTTTTDANGFYQFTNDQTNFSQDGTVTKTVTFPATQTNFNLAGTLAQFDPSLGQLQSVEIQHSGSITSEIKVENLSTDSTSQITGNVAGTLNFVAPGVNDNLAISGSAGSFNAAAYDGTTDFSGASGTSFGQKTASNSDDIMVTDPAALAAYTGTGTVNVTENANATSNATGGGNVEVNVSSTAQATITVIYHYKSAGPLLPGTYKVVQPVEPTGYTDGLESQGGTVIPGTIGTDFINVNLPAGGGSSTQNDFGELKTASLSGHVYYDANQNGIFDPNESGIAGVTMTLNGPGGPVTTTTDATGAYAFNTLLPGTYSVTETQPANYLNGTDTAGTKGGVVQNVVGNENINSITLASGDNAQNYDFGEIKPASLAGHVYYDANDNGTFDPTETGIAGVTMTLTGPGGPQSTTTDANGAYAFNNLAPGAYTVTETQPANYLNGTDTAGTKGGIVQNVVGNENINSINLASNDNGQNYDFGELKAASLAGNVYVDAKNDGQLDPGDPPIAHTVITLTGFDDNGPVSATTTTASNGSYSFQNLRPGNYAITETQPAGYNEGATTVGSQGGTGSVDVVSDITLNAGVNGINNNFGEVTPSTATPPPKPKDATLQGVLPFISKTQLTVRPTLANVDPVLRGQMAFAVGANITLTGQQLDLADTMKAVSQLSNGVTPQAYVNQVWGSDAHRAQQANNLYESILGRAPTAAETAAVTQQLDSGSSTVDVMQTLYTSAEFQQLHSSSQSLITALSQGILNTTPGSADSAAIAQSMANEPLNQVVSDLLNSTASVSNLIDSTYVDTLRRHATAAEIQTWTTPIQAGTMSIDDLAQRLLASQEFYQLAYNSIK